jgi:hypothetical protein
MDKVKKGRALQALCLFVFRGKKLGGWEVGRLGGWEAGRLGSWEAGKSGGW